MKKRSKTRKWIPWTQEEDRVIKNWRAVASRRSTAAKAIAEQLNRTEAAVKSRISRMEINGLSNRSAKAPVAQTPTKQSTITLVIGDVLIEVPGKKVTVNGQTIEY